MARLDGRNRRSTWIVAAVGALAVGVFVNCGKKEEPVVNDPATNPPAMPPAPGGNSAGGATTGGGGANTAAANPSGPPGSIEGVVSFTGKAPEMKDIPKPSDPVCAAAKPKENSVLVSNGGLKDVLVRIEVGGAKAGDVPTTAPQLKQEGCMYIPRILGVVAGQDIEVVNADKTMHNVHTYKGQETLLNAGQPAGSSPIKKPASDEAAVIKVKCDVHPWMTAYVIATDHPFFAVTDENGKFKIDKVPPGDYNVEAWHSEYGLKTMKIHVDSNKSVDPKFSYDGTEKKPE
jgi:plastocyanin